MCICTPSRRTPVCRECPQAFYRPEDGCTNAITAAAEERKTAPGYWKHEAERAHQEAAAERGRHLETLKKLEWYEDALAGLSRATILRLAAKARQEQVAP